MAKRNLLNVRSILERLVAFAADIQEKKYDNRLVPVYYDELMQMAFLAKAILRKNKAKGRKDVYVERKGE